MFKKQKSKILLFLLMLGLLYGCKRQLLDPLNPQTNLPQKVQFDKVKSFYEKGRYKNQPKRSSNGNERMTAQDSARFKDFEPQWDKTEVELLPNNEKMLIVPVVRFLQVEYKKEIGFIRRLCIRVDENDDFIEANIVELVGNLNFMKRNYNTIFANYKNTSIMGFSGVVIVSEIDYDLSIIKEYMSGAKIAVNPMKACYSVTIHVTGSTGASAFITTDSCSGEVSVSQITYPFGVNIGFPLYNENSGDTGGGGSSDVPTATPICKNCDIGISWEEEEMPLFPEVTGQPYTDLRDNINSLLPQINTRLTPPNDADLNPEQRQYLQNLQAGMTETQRIMEKIETNTSYVDLDVVTDATLVDAAYISYDLATGKIKISICPKPVQVANPTPEQEIAFDEKLNEYYGNLAHELKHVEQYLDGQMSFDKITGQAGRLHDAYDEIAGYNLYALMLGKINTLYTTAPSIRTILSGTVLVYPTIPLTNNTVGNTPATTLTNDFYIIP